MKSQQPKQTSDKVLFSVEGAIRKADNSPFSAIQIQVVDKDMYGKENLLGETSTDKEGYYKIVYTAAQFRLTAKERGGADLVVRVLDKEGNVIAASRKVSNAKQEETINITLKKAKQPAGQPIVYGRITNMGKPLTGVSVKAYDKDLRREQWLGEAYTNDGNYEITYNDSQYSLAENNAADLFIRVFDANEKLLTVSDTVYNAAAKQEINCEITDYAVSAWDKLNEALISLLKEQKLSSGDQKSIVYTDLLQQELNIADIQFLVAETGLGYDAISPFVKSYSLAAQQSDIPAEVYYAWLSNGLPAELPGILQTSTEGLIAMVKQAIADNTIPKATGALLDKIQAIIHQLKDEADTLAMQPTIDKYARYFNGNRKTTEAFSKIYFSNKGNWPAIRQELTDSKAFSKNMVAGILFTHDLVAWTEGNTVLMDTFHKDDNLNSMRDIALNLNKGALARKITAAAIPPLQTKEDFANQLYNTLYVQEPTAVLINMINDPKVPLWNNELGKTVAGLLAKAPEFNIRTTSIHELLKNETVQKLIEKSTVLDLSNQLKAAQRVSLISPTPESIPALISKNYLSAYAITLLPSTQFINSMKDAGLTDDILTQIYNEAEKKKATYENMLVTIREAGLKTGIAMIDGKHNKDKGGYYHLDPEIQNILAKNNLSWDLLFGEANYCPCGECTSVYSAAAYYVDLLQYLRNNNLSSNNANTGQTGITNTPLEKLFARRPDLGHLELSCENTNTILPYVDLVNEVLEQYIAFHARNEDFGNYIGFNVAGESSQELLAAPQHTERDYAYQKLQNSFFPFTLPYHQPIDATRIFLKQLNTSRYELLNIFGVNNPNNHIVSAAEFLGLTEEEYCSITGESFSKAPDSRRTHEYYGFASGGATTSSWRTQLSAVKDAFLPRTGIQYTDLLALLQTQYINQGFTIPEYIAMLSSLSEPFFEVLHNYENDVFGDLSTVLPYNPRLKELLDIYDQDTKSQKLAGFFRNIAARINTFIVLSPPKTDCSLESVVLCTYDNALLTTDIFDKLNRFIRLWRKLGLTIAETDAAITTFGAGTITPELIHDLAIFKKLLLRTGIEPMKLLCLWGNISTTGENSLYKQHFLARNLMAMDSIFATYLSGTTTVQAHLPVVMAALNLSANDILLITTYKSLPQQLELTIENLSLLYRFRVLSKAMGLNIPAFIRLIETTGDPFESPDTTLEFLLNIDEVEDAGLAMEDAAHVINGTVSSSAASKKERLLLSKKIHDTLTAIDKDHSDPDGTTGVSGNDIMAEQVRNKALLLFDADRTEQIISFLEGKSLYSAVAPVLTVQPRISPTIAPKISYLIDSTVGKAAVQVTGMLTATELTTLKAAVTTVNAAWEKAVSDIETLQNEQFASLFSGIFANAPAEAAILLSQNTESSAASKYLAFLKVFLPYLREKLKKLHINAVFAEQTGLNLATAHVLLNGILQKNNVSLYDLLIEEPQVAIPDSIAWHGKLIPTAADEFRFVVRTANNRSFKVILDNVVVLQHTDPEFTGEPLMLIPGTVYQLTLEGVTMGELYWKTKTSAIESIPDQALLPDFRRRATRSALDLISRIAVLSKKLPLSADELNYFYTHRSSFDNINFNSPSFYHVVRIIRYCRFRDSLPSSGINLLQFWKLLNDQQNDLAELIARLTKWDKEAIDILIAARHFNLTKSDFRNERGLIQLQQALECAAKIGVDTTRLFEWSGSTSDFNICKTVADGIRMALGAKYSEADWKQVVKPLNDELRSNQKNALIAYLLQQPALKDAGVRDADGLFEYFLIDVQMDTCMETSRIKQAISSVQLFIQRCFLGLEEEYSGIAPDALDRPRWEWMQQYRLWEANRKVFLYPENWIESNLRDDKSPFFKELESELLQKDINKQNVTDALKTYLYKVDEVANMEVVGIYIEGEKNIDTNWPQGSKLHVFSRTRNAPYFFYYRYLALDEMNWYPWEKVQVDVPCYDVEGSDGKIWMNGCYLTPVVWNGRLLIFFPQLMKKTKSNSNSTGKLSVLADKDQSNLKPIEYWEIKMAWSEYRNRKWTQKQLSKNSLYNDDDRYSIKFVEGYRFYPEISDVSLTINIFEDVSDVDTAIGYYIGMFSFNGSDLQASKPIVVNESFVGSRFQHSCSFRQSIYSSQQIHPKSYSILFDDYEKTTFDLIPNRMYPRERISYPFHFLNSAKLLDIEKPSAISELFKFSLTIPHGDDSTNAFGEYLPSTYHELKRPYSLYNWELFFHTPMMLANALSNAQQFEEAMKWFHYVVNPMAEGIEDNRFWQFAPFRDINSRNILSDIFDTLGANQWNGVINEWRNNPFKPHLVARSRPVAYMKWVVMKYIDNILDWGDYLFRQDTIESINQATQLYILAEHILGAKPTAIPSRGKTATATYHSLMNKWDAFSNAICELEISAVYSTQPAQYVATNEATTATAGIFGSASALYFCIPDNPKLRAYWDTLADRLFKIRHCQNIDGVFRRLPLFEPPIDPALMVKAATQGISISGVLNDLNTPMPNYRFYYLLQKALELCNELKSLGGAMLAAIEKKDNETISLIRARHENAMNNMVMEIKKTQLEEAQKSLEALLQNRKVSEARMRYYLQLIGEDPAKIPGIDTDFTELANAIDQPLNESGLKLSKYEKEDYDKSHAAHGWQMSAGVVEALSAIFHAIPNATLAASPFGVGGSVGYGGTNLGNMSNAMAKVAQLVSSQLSFEASNAAKKGGFQRAMQDRIFQANTTGYELKQIDKQITTQQIRIDLANQDIRNQQKQIDNAAEVEEFLKNKYSNEELYTWMRSNLKSLYHQVYNLAYDLTKKAERTYCFERGISSAGFIQSSYFDAGREGLLAGEQLYVGLKQLEAAYHDKRGYDYEITKHISLSMLDPLALLQLKTTGACEFEIPEVLFDMDYPGHFKRRIKSISLSIPCIAGPYTGVNASLRLLNHKFRNSSIPNDYPEKTDVQDDRFVTYNIPVTAIATSSGQNDSGMFELNFKDERYLPFEGAGVISRWGLELPAIKQFDYNTISDVILHVKYMASEGGQQLKTSAGQSVFNRLNHISQQLNETGLHIPLSLEHDMPNEWHLLKSRGLTSLKIKATRLPYMMQTTNCSIKKVLLFIKVTGNPGTFSLNIAGNRVDLVYKDGTGFLFGTCTSIQLDTGFEISLLNNGDKELIKECIMIVQYGI